MRTRRRLVLLPAALLVVAGCSQPTSSAPTTVPPELPTTLAGPSTTAPLRTGAVPGAVPARDRTFSLLPPAGWQDLTTRQRDASLYLRAPQPSANVYPSFTVVATTLKEPPRLDELVNQGMIAQRQKGGTVTKLADRDVGGAPAAGYAIARISQGFRVTQTQYYVVTGDRVVVTTMTTAAQDKAAATSTQEAILASWSWGPAPSTAAPSATPGSTATPSPTPPPPTP